MDGVTALWYSRRRRMRPRMEIRVPTPRKRKHRPRDQRPRAASSRLKVDPTLLLDVVDELDLISSLLRCVPQIQQIEDRVWQQQAGTHTVIGDPIGGRLAGTRRQPFVPTSSRTSEEPTSLIGSTDALNHSAIWMVERLSALLSSLIGGGDD